MGEWLSQIGQQALEAVNNSTPPVLVALFLVTFLTEFGVPFPWVQDIVFYYLGFQFGSSITRAFPIMLVMVLGRIMGATVLFGVANIIGPRLIDRIGRRFPSFPKRVDTIKRRLCSHSILAMTGVRLMPGMLIPSTIAAGAIRLHYFEFVLGIIFASIVDDGTTLLSGLVTRVSIDYFGVQPTPWLFSIGVIATMVLVWVLPWFIFRRRGQGKT